MALERSTAAKVLRAGRTGSLFDSLCYRSGSVSLSLGGLAGGPLVVLATASREHPLEAFELGVLDYLLEPFSEERVEQCLRRIIERRPRSLRLRSPIPQRIVARRKKSLVFLEADEV